MDKLSEIISRCKASVTIDINAHKAYYDSVKRHLAERCEDVDPREEDSSKIIEDLDISQDVFDGMVANDNIITIQFYPHTPIGCYIVYHYDLDKCLDRVIKILNEEC